MSSGLGLLNSMPIRRGGGTGVDNSYLILSQHNIIWGLTSMPSRVGN